MTMGNCRKVAFWQGNTAVAMGAIAAGCRFYAGYPITPSTEIAEVMAEELPKVGGRFIQMEDEIGSMAAALGASVAGLKSMTATSGPGMSLKLENIGYGYMTEIPVVVVNVQRGGPSTGLPTKASQSDVMQARWGTHGDYAAIAVAPSSVQECYELTVYAFNLSERFRQPVIVLTDEIVGHMRERIEVPDPSSLTIVNRKRPTVPPSEYLPYKADPEDDVPPMASFGDGYRWYLTGITHDERGLPATANPKKCDEKVRRIIRKVMRFKDEIVRWDGEGLEDARVVVFSYGSVSRTALSAVRQMRSRGVKVGHFRPITLWPFPEEQLKACAPEAKFFVVPELNAGQMVLEVERVVGRRAEVLSITSVNGELFQPSDIARVIEEVA